ncbi:MAG: hydrogenase small subunit, partial [Actinobacteria bacterium]|nr:hydrogenase small subunit [Actinomycetota bacterium]
LPVKMIFRRTTFIPGVPRLLSHPPRRVAPPPQQSHTVTTGYAECLSLLRPRFAYGYRVHDNCERRAHFDAGEYVQQWGDAGAKNNFCLYKMGCKGPMTYNNCSIIRYNEGTNWPIGAGHGCIGCSELGFWDRYAHERPLASADIHAAGPFGLGIESSVDKFGVGLLAATGVGIALHAVLSATAGRHDRPGDADLTGGE